MTDQLILPHGGILITNIADEVEHADLHAHAKSLPHIQVGTRQLADLEMLAIGAYSPLRGFMGHDDYLAVLDDMHLSNGLPWSVPITLAVTQHQADTLRPGSEVALVNRQGMLQAVMTVEDKFGYDKRHEAHKVYRTEDEAHPGVKVVYHQGEVLLGGPVRVVALQQQLFPEHRLTPTQSRTQFVKRGWRRVVGFQTRNPVHRAHEYIQKCAMETVDGLFLHPLVGDTKGDDIPADVRMRCYEVLLDNYYPVNRVILGVLPAAMRYAGPREAIFHALMRKNYGCSHFIVGRDHAGVGNYYGSYDAHHIFAEVDAEKLGIIPMFFDHTFFCRACDAMASSKTCPHGNEHHVTLSGTKVRQMLQAGEVPPREFSRPEVAKVLIEAMRQVVA
ncbi:MAG: sulfate adenylyltransferase [Ktedonobacteraceae bacterium]